MNRLFVFLLGALLALLLPATALAADSTSTEGLIFKIGGATTVGPAERVDSVIVINGDVLLQGTATSTLWVIHGDAVVSGRVNGDVMVVDGTLTLQPGAVVKNVSLVRGTLAQDPGASITGDLNERSAFVSFGWGPDLFSFTFWLATTIPLILAGLLFAWLGGAQLRHAGATLSGQPGASVLAALVAGIGLPILGVLAILTLIGIPIGVVILASAPVLWVLGYLVTAGRIGAAIVGRVTHGELPDHPYLATSAGVVAVQLIGLIPFLGGVVVALAGMIGTGALALLAFHARRESSARRRAQIQHAPPTPA
jgi:hypothetical protein